MEYDNTISDVVRVVEAVGAGIMVVGGLGAFVIFIARAAQPDRRAGSYKDLRRNLGRCILLGLEVLIVADIVRDDHRRPDVRERPRAGRDRHDPDRAQLLARGRDGRRVAVEPPAAARSKRRKRISRLSR
jgi:uncharacterized membrane protein